MGNFAGKKKALARSTSLKSLINVERFERRIRAQVQLVLFESFN